MKRSAGHRVVVVTGASAGVGRATARAFARRGASVGLLARGPEGLAGALDEVQEEGARGLALPTDVSKAEQVEAAAATIEEELGPIDVWVNDAMVTVFAPVHAVAPDEFHRVTEVTYLGTVYGTMTALRLMQARDRGVIVQVGSALAYRGIPLQSAYCGAKHAIEGFTESLRCELAHERSGVRVTIVQLPALNTPQFGWSRSRMLRRARPVPPIYQPELAANAIVWAASHRRREVFVGGPTVATILGQRTVPGLLDRYLARTGYDAQQTTEPEDPSRPDNLFQPVPVDHGAHGTFDDVAHRRSAELWMATHRWSLLGAGLAAGAIVAGAVRRRA